METDPFIIQPPDPFPDPLPIPLIYNDSIDTTNMINVLLIDSILYDKQVFYDSANANTFPIIYDSTSKTDDLLALLRQKFSASSIQRISLVFHDRGPNVQALFMNNKIFFEDTDLEVNRTSFSENVSFLISCINEFHVGHIDYLACNTLQYSNWKSYYALLASQTSVVVGASNDATGNMQYSGDWVMENTSEDVMNIYFDANISSYVSLLASTISQSGGIISLKMDTSGQFVQYSSNGGTYTSIPAASWPITITNSSPSAGNILRVVLTTDIILTTTYTGGVNSWLLAGSSYITFDGSSNYVRINGITNYKGFIDNGLTQPFGFDNVIVKNFNTATIGTSSLAANAGWLCTGFFGYGASGNVISGCTNSGPVAGGGNTGGIAGHIVGGYFGIVDISGCTNNGAISGNYAGGIAGGNAGLIGGIVKFLGCANNGAISGNYAGGIAGGSAGQDSGTATFTACINTGDITGSAGGGIVGYSAGLTNGIVDISGCMNTGAISQIYAGGIAGANFAYNTIQTCRITNCYSVGDVNGSVAGGITGAAVGATTSGTYLPKIVNISNCYSLGTIATSCGGICGGTTGIAYIGTPTINITNCYSWGLVTNPGSGIVATSLPIPTNQNNIYVANTSWTDASANTSLTGTPTSLTIGNPGATWTKIANNTITPYVLSYFNAQLYSPNNASSSSNNYTTSAGLFTDSSYNLLYNDQSGNVATTRVFVAKGSTPYYYSYNNNTFTFTNTNPSTSTEAIDVSITPSNGRLSVSVACFKKGTKILCENDVYIPVEELKIGDLVKTYKHGYQKIIMHAHSSLCDYFQNKVNKLYTYSREKNPDLIEDLHLTGGHSLLLDTLTDEELTNMKQIPWSYDEFIVEDKYKLLACLSSELCVATEQNVEIYHFTIEPPENAKSSHVYGVYANGILAESCSKGTMEIFLGKINNTSCDSNETEQIIRPQVKLPNPLPVPLSDPLPDRLRHLLPRQVPTPLIYNDLIDTTNMTNVMLIDSIVANDKQFYDSVNANTFPIIYNYNSSTDVLISLLRRKFPTSSIQRIALVFHDKGINFITKFMNNKLLFEENDLEENQISFTENVSFLISCIKEFHMVHIDYLACNTLQYSNWKSYYALIASHTSVVVGASNNDTGNINYGGDWVMENTCENVRDLYFNENISNYASTLVQSTIELNGANGPVGLKMNIGVIEYFDTSFNTWVPIGSGNWPVVFINSTSASSVLRVVATQDLTITDTYGGTSGFFIAGSTNITFDGSGNTITITNVLLYPGFIDNGNTLPTGFENIIVKNFNTTASGTSTLSDIGGWLCQTYFAYRAASGNVISGCTNSGAISGLYAGGIIGNVLGYIGSASIINCTNSGVISGNLAGGIVGAGAGPFGIVDISGCTNIGRINGLYTGGIAGNTAGVSSGTARFINCVNSGDISGNEAGGIAGRYAGSNNGSALFTNCINNGNIIGNNAGGIAGYSAGYNSGSATFTTCTNNRVISGSGAGGIAGVYAGFTNGIANFISCINNGDISGNQAGGIAGMMAGYDTASASFTNCTNIGVIRGDQAGGIAGYSAGASSGLVSFTTCTNIGIISGDSAGGISGYYAGYSSGLATFTTCLNNGPISGNSAGGIAGVYAGYDGSANFTNCINNGDISGNSAGGIAGSSAGYNTGSVIFTNCTNSGNIIALYGGGITGTSAGVFSGIVDISGCRNTGIISGTYAGGIAGQSAGQLGMATFTTCINSGRINGDSAGGIAGRLAGYSSGLVTFRNCMNSGDISGNSAGGIAGVNVAYSGSAKFTNCTNTGAINGGGGIAGNDAGQLGIVDISGCISTGTIGGQYAGGIVGSKFAANTTQTCSITNCYSIGDISGNNAGGIAGASIGITSSATYLPKIVNISNCYSLGRIYATAGGICGGTDNFAYVGTPTINIINCYSYGIRTDPGSGIVAISLLIPINQLNTYVANGSWSDTNAKASLTGTPTSLTIGNPGSTWTKILNGTITPYVLSYFNAQLYNPNSVNYNGNYTTSAGLFVDPSYNYQIVYNDQSGNVATTRVFVSKGITPYYYSYNSNTFRFTNLGTATDIINVGITQSTGILRYVLSAICFKKGTKILCENDMYIPIEELKIGDLVKTYKHDYQKIIMRAHSNLSDYAENRFNKLYTYSREKNPDLIEDVHLTGGHSLLLDILTEEELTNMNQINWPADDFMVEDKYKLLAGFSSELCVATEQDVEIYHFTLEPPENAKPNFVYGIYANGILAESCSKGAMEEFLGKNNILCDSKKSEQE